MFPIILEYDKKQKIIHIHKMKSIFETRLLKLQNKTLNCSSLSNYIRKNNIWVLSPYLFLFNLK